MTPWLQLFVCLLAFIGGCVLAVAFWLFLSDVVRMITKRFARPTWTSCKTAKPAVGQSVLVWRDIVGPLTQPKFGFYVSRIRDRHPSDGTPFWEGIGYDTSGHVTHWMPLPEVPDAQT